MLPVAPLDIDLFADSYATARARFSVLAKRAGADRASWEHPRPGPDGGALATDVAWVGPVEAGRVLVLQSGLHGVEGFAGAAVQCDLLAQFPAAALPPDTALLFIHAINPWGFAWSRRCNEDGVDLNRNFVDFSAPLPENRLYDELAAALVPHGTDPALLAAGDALLAARREKMGTAAFEAALSRGQYRHAQGLYYGGTGPSWSRRTVTDIAARYGLRARRQVVHLDLHTGIGPWGHGELICDHAPDSPGVRIARALFGPALTEPWLGTSVSGVKDGLVDFWWERELGVRLCFVTLECGTYPFAGLLRTLRLEHMLHAAGPAATEVDRQAARAALREHFCPSRRDWRELLLFRARQVVDQILQGMTA